MNLWGDDFDIPNEQDEAKRISKKLKEKTAEQKIKSKSLSIEEKLGIIKENVDKTLSRYKDTVMVIYNEEQLSEYIDKAIENGVIAIDTETNNSLDPLTCKIMGACLYTPDMKSVYVPINHVDFHTEQRLENQVTEEQLKRQLERLGDTKVITHNGSFDYQVLKCAVGYKMKIYWDTMIGAFILDENEKSYKLKTLYTTKIDPDVGTYSIEELFANIEYKYVTPETFSFYSATDTYITYRLYEWEKAQYDLPENKDLYHVILDIEFPLIEVVAEMELAGCYIDQDYGKSLQDYYENELKKSEIEIQKELDKLKPQIDKWRLTPEANIKADKHGKNGVEEGAGKSKTAQLEDPVNIGSPTQLAILFYDVLKVPPQDGETARSTGESALQKIKLPICEAILKQRSLVKLMGTYVNKLPSIVNPTDQRLHGRFNQIGTATGRLSSSDPNLQNIPSENKMIRCLFKPEKGNKYVSADFSQAEPRLLAYYSQDETMINAYENKRDLYAEVASIVYNNKYEDNLEFNPDGSMNYEGKERRASCKSLILGMMYGRGVTSIAEQTHMTVQQAQNLMDTFFNRFPKVQKWIDESKQMAREKGYVTTLEGRRRRLPNVNLPDYSVYASEYLKGQTIKFNPFLDCDDGEDEQVNLLIESYKQRCNKIRSTADYTTLKTEAKANGIIIESNKSYKREAERQCVNARVQGGSADITKKAMVAIYNDEELNRLGFKLLLSIHDELLGECPEENAEEVGKRLVEIMLEAPYPKCTVPFKCDFDINDCWYQTEYAAFITEEYDNLCKEMTKEEAFEYLTEQHPERPREYLEKIVA